MSLAHGTVPSGRYRAVVVSRTTVTSPPSGPGAGDRRHLEIVFRLQEGPNAGHALKMLIWAEGKLLRARRLRQHEEVVVVVRAVEIDGGRTVPRVVDFSSAREPSVIEALAASDGGAVVARPVVAAAAGIQLPEDLRHKLLMAGKPDAAATDIGTLLAAAMTASPSAETYKYGLLRVGPKNGGREIVDHDETLAAYASHSGLAAGRAESPAYLSLYRYASDLADYRRVHEGSLAGYRGRAWGAWFAMDFDGEATPEGLRRTLGDARRVTQFLIDRGVPPDKVLLFFSGEKGFHLLFPSACCGANSKVGFEGAVERFCVAIAELVEAKIDVNVYKSLASLRAPNTPHDRSGLYKVLLPHEQLDRLGADGVTAMARSPRPFVMPSWRMKPVPVFVDLWRWACHAEVSEAARITAAIDGERRIYADTLEFVAHGAPEGQRGTRLFRAAMNLLDFEAPERLLRALLEPAARLSGYRPEECDAQINGAIAAHERQSSASNASPRREDF